MISRRQFIAIVATGGSAIVHRDLIVTLAARHNCPQFTSNVSSLPPGV